MKHLPRKWVLLGVSFCVIGAGSVFLLKLTAHSEAPATAKRAPLAQDTPEHELKELGVQLEKKPGHVPVLIRMAQIEHDQGKPEDAIQHLREAVKSEPSNSDAHLELGRLLYEKGDLAAGIAETEKVLEINPKHVDALYNLGAIYANLGNQQRARSYWNRAVETDPAADSSRKAREGLTKLGGS